MRVGKAMCSPCTAARVATCTSTQNFDTARTLNAVPRARTTGLCCWQRPDSSHRRHTAQLCRSSDRDADLVESMKNDMERLQRKQTADSDFRGESELRQRDSKPAGGFAESLKQTIDKPWHGWQLALQRRAA
ncbi:hypothetical protein ABBQ32_011142 [Trebouxia sp. C0010 RCD-2024]